MVAAAGDVPWITAKPEVGIPSGRNHAVPTLSSCPKTPQ
jgi:hypothetical protein